MILEQAFLMYEITFLCWFGEILNEVFSLLPSLLSSRLMWEYICERIYFKAVKWSIKAYRSFFFVSWMKGWQAEYIAETWFIFYSTTFFSSFFHFSSLNCWSWVLFFCTRPIFFPLVPFNFSHKLITQLFHLQTESLLSVLLVMWVLYRSFGPWT